MNIHTLDLCFQDIERAIAVFVVEGPAGRVLLEAGPASTLPHLSSALEKKGWQLADFQHIFLSHIHFDHAGAAWAFAEKGATIHVHPKGSAHLAAPERLYNSAKMIYGDQMESLWGEMRPIDPTHLHTPTHGEVLEVAGLHFTAWFTPGHAVHHIAWQVDDPHTGESVLFTGDVAGVKIGDGPVAPPCPPPDIQVEDWQASLQLLRDLPANHLYLTHYGQILDKKTHLDALENRLLAWADWMRAFAVEDTPIETIVPLFQQYVSDELRAAGVGTADLARYEAANPAFMSVAGLMRYWKKRFQSSASPSPALP